MYDVAYEGGHQCFLQESTIADKVIAPQGQFWLQHLFITYGILAKILIFSLVGFCLAGTMRIQDRITVWGGEEGQR